MDRLLDTLLGKWRADPVASDAFEHALEAIFVTDSRGDILRVNRAFMHATGYSAAEVMGRNPRLLQSGRQDADFYHAFWEALTTHGEWRGDIWNRRKDGEVYAQRLQVACIRGTGGEVRGYVATFSDITERKRHELMLEHQAQHDALTGLPNRVLFRDRLQRALASARRNASMLAVMFLDLDHFKRVNDEHGHDVGDELLRQVAQRIGAAVREADTVARLSGDEFTVLLPEVADAPAAVGVGDKVLAATHEPYHIAGLRLTVTSSVGISLFPAHGDEADVLMQRADAAMYQVKGRGRRGCGVFGCL